MGLCESPQGPCKTGETILFVCELDDDKTAAHGAFCTATSKSEKEFIVKPLWYTILERVVVVFFITPSFVATN